MLSRFRWLMSVLNHLNLLTGSLNVIQVNLSLQISGHGTRLSPSTCPRHHLHATQKDWQRGERWCNCTIWQYYIIYCFKFSHLLHETLQFFATTKLNSLRFLQFQYRNYFRLHKNLVTLYRPLCKKSCRHICILFLPEGQTSKAWEPSKTYTLPAIGDQ